MLILASTSDLVRVVTTAAGAIAVHASWVDLVDAATSATPSRTNTASITTATTTTVVASPGVNTKRNVRRLKIKNTHASVSNTVTVEHTDGTNVSQEISVTLLPGEMAILNAQGTWFFYDQFLAVRSGPTATVRPPTNDFRLSGVSATPVMTADNTALSTIFLCQYKGGDIALFDGVRWQLCTPASEVSLAVTGRTTDLPFDIFAFLSAGVVTLEFTDWTNATTRATGLTRVDGVWTRTGASTRRYLGSCRARSATTFSFVMAGLDTGTSARLDIWNVDNRVEQSFTLRAGANTWAYTVATWRQAQALTTMQVDVMVGLQEDWLSADLLVTSRNSTISIARNVGIGFDSTTAFTGTTSSTTNEVASIDADQNARIAHQPTIGRHFYAWLEISTATGTCTWVGDDGALRIQSGMTGNWKC